ncbi:MAG: hypothetical protein ORN58_00770 [Sediminibacterium sp.]|nr:hypothetical protein [Sediminibacterium sp.]
MKKSIPFILLIIIYIPCIGQGCSDAGFCSISALKAQSKLDTKNRITVASAIGVGDENVLIVTPSIQYERKINKNWAFQSKLTYNYADGNLGTYSNLGDLYVTGTYNTFLKNNWNFSILFGTKINTNGANKTTNLGLGLPMLYQSSLGTTDLITGAVFTKKRWKISIGYQAPISGNNLNTFLPNNWKNIKSENVEINASNPKYLDAKNYIPTNQFNRKSDGLLNIGYDFTISKKMVLQIGLLNIYHFGTDTYIDPNANNGSTEPIPLIGSDGLTLNGTMAAFYKINKKIQIGFTSGMPFIVRKIRPDGLTRHFVIAPELVIHF